MMNALSIDLEDWFCAFNFASMIPFERWGTCEFRLVRNTHRILAKLSHHDVHATFFVLGWVAERVPSLISEIENEGHEIAVHGYNHKPLTSMTPEEFEHDLCRTLEALEHCHVQQKIVGYRAPCFTITNRTLWAIPILERYHFRYDSSVFPFGLHPDYGIQDAPLGRYSIGDRLLEFPLTCIELFGKRLPCAGGAYFRFFPYSYTRMCIARCNAQGRSAVFYLHPWEIDPNQPKVPMSRLRRMRHYYHLDKTETRFERLLTDFSFTTIREILHV